jgi:hypothetical protein
LSRQHDGLLITRDELASWLNGIDKYQSGKGANTGDYLSAWSGESVTQDRKTGDNRLIYVARASVSIVGGSGVE